MIIHIKSVKPQESANGAIVDLTKNLLCSNQTPCVGFLEDFQALAYKPKNIRTMAGASKKFAFNEYSKNTNKRLFFGYLENACRSKQPFISQTCTIEDELNIDGGKHDLACF